MIRTPQVIIGPKFVESVLPLINEAKQSIEILIFDWRVYYTSPNHPVNQLNTALISAARRGVSVRVLVNNQTVCDYLNKVGIKSRVVRSSKILHAKMMLIDSRYCVCGSHNYTQGGFVLNYEISLAVDLGGIDNDMKKYFNDLYGI